MVLLSQRSQVYEPDSVRELLEHARRHSDGQPRFANAARSGEGEDAAPPCQQFRHLGDLVFAADDVAGMAWQVMTRLNVGLVEGRGGRHPRCDLASRGEAQLVADLFDMPFRSSLGDEEPLSDLAVRQALSDELRHLTLTARERQGSVHNRILLLANRRCAPGHKFRYQNRYSSA